MAAKAPAATNAASRWRITRSPWRGSGVQRRRPEQLLWLVLARRQSLTLRVVEHPVELVPGLGEAPAVNVRADDRALLLPQRAVPERGHVNALPLLVLVALALGSLAGVEEAPRHPRMLLEDARAYEQRVHDREALRAPEVVLLLALVVGKQEIDIRVNPRREEVSRDAGDDLARGQQIEERLARRRVFELEPGGRLPVRQAHRVLGHPGDRREIHAVLLLERALGPQRGAGDPGLQAHAPAVEVRRLPDSRFRVHINVRVPEHPLDEDRDRGEAEFLAWQV